MQKLAQSWLVLQLSGSPVMLGLDTFLGEIPIFLFSLVGGAIADRMDRRRLLVGSQVIQMSCALTLAALFALGAARVWHILSLSFVVGLAQAFGGPAYQAIIPTMVDKEDVPNAIAMNSIQFNLARVICPAIGGFALTKFGAAWCFGLNGASFVAVIVSLMLVHIRFVPSPSGQSLMESMKSGLTFIRAREAMVSLIVLAFLMTLLGIPLIAFLPVVVRDVFRSGPDTYTLLLGVSGAGAIGGGLLVAASGHRPGRGRNALVTLILLGLFMAGFARSRLLWLSCVLLFLAGVALISTFALLTSLVQLVATDEMRGRVMSVYNVAFRGGMPFGGLMTGPLVDRFSAPPVLAAYGGLIAVLGLYYLLVHRKVASL